ncbi:MAG: hypothetical protein AAGE80_09800 [Pseudomonadota bacterium]
MANNVQEVLVAPVASMISEVGESVAEAANSLNAAQIEAFKAVPQELIDAGVIPSFYHMQAVEVELKMTLQIEREEQQTQPAPRKRKWRLFSSPISAKTEAVRKTAGTGSSTLKMTFAPGPPPIALAPGPDTE